MKVVKVLLYGLLAFVIIGAILGLTGPKTYKVERSVVIAAAPDQVWPHMSSLRKSNEWSPFLKKDSAAVVTYSGNDVRLNPILFTNHFKIYSSISF